MKRTVWFFASAIALAAAMALVPPKAHAATHHSDRRATSTVSVGTSSCPNEWVIASTTLAGNSTFTQWVKGNGSTVNGCGWQQRCHVHFGIPRIGDDDGWKDGGWVTSGTVQSGCNSPDGDSWFVFDVQWRTGPGATVHTVRVSP